MAFEGHICFLSYLGIMCEAAVAFGYILVDMGKYVGSICSFIIMACS